MLKFILPLLMLMKYSKNWNLIQLGLFFMSYMFSLSCYHNFFFMM